MKLGIVFLKILFVPQTPHTFKFSYVPFSVYRMYFVHWGYGDHLYTKFTEKVNLYTINWIFMTCLILCWSCFGMSCTRLLVCCGIWHKHVTAGLLSVVYCQVGPPLIAHVLHIPQMFDWTEIWEFGGHITPESCCSAPPNIFESFLYWWHYSSCNLFH